MKTLIAICILLLEVSAHAGLFRHFLDGVVNRGVRESERFIHGLPNKSFITDGWQKEYFSLGKKYGMMFHMVEFDKNNKEQFNIYKILHFIASIDDDAHLGPLLNRAVLDHSVKIERWEWSNLMLRAQSYIALLQFDPYNRKFAQRALDDLTAAISRAEESAEAYAYRGFVNMYFHRTARAYEDFDKVREILEGSTKSERSKAIFVHALTARNILYREMSFKQDIGLDSAGNVEVMVDNNLEPLFQKGAGYQAENRIWVLW